MRTPPKKARSRPRLRLRVGDAIFGNLGYNKIVLASKTGGRVMIPLDSRSNKEKHGY